MVVAVRQLTEQVKSRLILSVTLSSTFPNRTDHRGCETATPYLVNMLIDHYKIEAAEKVDTEAARAAFKSVFRLGGSSHVCTNGLGGLRHAREPEEGAWLLTDPTPESV